MIDLCAKELGGAWFGLAHVGERVVATAVASTRERAVRNLRRSIPPDSEYQISEESAFAEKAIHMLRDISVGNEEAKAFVIADEFIPEPSRRVLRIAAAIPIGYVASYGGIAKAAGTGPRVVGRIMASNPLYPIVPCHRVVGADFSLVGYGGSKGPKAQREKLNRLRKEARGFSEKMTIAPTGRSLTVYPVEYVIRKAKQQRLGDPVQKRLLETTTQ